MYLIWHKKSDMYSTRPIDSMSHHCLVLASPLILQTCTAHLNVCVDLVRPWLVKQLQGSHLECWQSDEQEHTTERVLRWFSDALVQQDFSSTHQLLLSCLAGQFVCLLNMFTDGQLASLTLCNFNKGFFWSPKVVCICMCRCRTASHFKTLFRQAIPVGCHAIVQQNC